MNKNTLEQFDLVTINTTRHVRWMTDLPNISTDPYGLWSVVCVFPKIAMVLLQKESALIRIPIADVTRIGSYNLNNIFNKLNVINEKYIYNRTISKDQEIIE